MPTWIALITSLPTENATARMRAWRSLKASGAAVLRDGVYLIEGFGAQGFWIHDLRHGHGGLKRGKGRLSEFSGCAGSAGAGIVGPEELDPCCIP